MNQTQAFPVGGAQPTHGAHQTTHALASILSFDQLSLAPDYKTSSWRDPVRRQRPAPATPSPRVGADDGAMHWATMAALRSIESRAAKADTWELRRALDDLHQVLGVLRGDDELDYARCLVIKLQALLDEQLVDDVATAAARAPGAGSSSPTWRR